MRAKTVGILAVGTVVLSVCAGMTLSAKSISGDSSPHISIEKPRERPHMDLAFCIDTTGSMQGEIDMVKSKVKDLVAKLSSGKPAPLVRVGLVAFRDRGDTYVTKLYPFTEDIDKFVKDISELQANGGGDGPESVNEALHVTINDLSWDESKKTAKLIFLIGDAGPHYYPNDYNWADEAKSAIAKGIQINTLACSGLESTGDGGMDVFQKIAKLSDGQFENLAYRQIVRDERGKETTIISSAGDTYAVAEGASAEWKSGARALSAAGKASPMAALSRPRGGAGFGMFGGAPASRAFRGEAASASMADVGAAASSGVSAGVSSPVMEVTPLDRKDSNLDALMYDAAMKKAREKLNVSY